MGDEAGFPIVDAVEFLPIRQCHYDFCADAAAIIGDPSEPHLQVVDSFLFAQIADEHLRVVVILIGDDIEIAVIVQIENHR